MQAKKAASSSNLRYVTLGFDVTLSGSGKSVTFAVKRGDTLREVPGSSRTNNGYEYILYRISTEDIIKLAQAVGGSDAKTVLKTSKIKVQMDAIMTTMKNGSNKGSISEDGSGGLHETGSIYHLKNSEHLDEMMDIFSGHKFKSYTNIPGTLNNYPLSIIYDAGDGASVGNGYYKDTYSAGSTKLDNAIYESGSVYMDSRVLMEEFYLKSPSSFGLSKTGYHIIPGREWEKANGTTYTHSKLYGSKQLDPEVGYQKRGVILYANWEPNSYTVIYNANGGYGAVAPSAMIYDHSINIRTNTFQRTGYYLPKGREWIDENGNTYTNRQLVSNLTSEDGGTVTLYANWEPVVVMLNFDKRTGSGGTDYVYEKYNTGFYSDANCTSGISNILIPSKFGYDFLGYYAGLNSGGTTFVNKDGSIAIQNTFLQENTTAYADWKAKQFTVTFNRQGGSYGTTTAIATYEADYPQANSPIKSGYTFKGYYTQANGKGTQVYNEYMATDKKYLDTANKTLYAYWVDEVPPEINLAVTNDSWTNEAVTLRAEAEDDGSGLKSVTIYQIATNGSLTKVAEQTNLGGAKSKTVTFKNTKEGIIRYKAIAVDVAGNTSESYNTVYYDKTAPSGEVIEVTINGTTFYFDINITDINTGN